MFDIEMTYDEWAKLTVEERQELDRNYWRYGFGGKFMFERMTEEERNIFKGKEMKV